MQLFLTFKQQSPDRTRRIFNYSLSSSENIALGGKILPSLPPNGKKKTGDRRQLMEGTDAISGVADECAKMDISGVKARLVQAAAQSFCSPTFTLEPLEQASPPSPDVDVGSILSSLNCQNVA
jgi:hypothetical protein